VPAAQTCCGQPAYNSGDRRDTRDIARQVIAAFEKYDYVVAPSGSCGGMMKMHYAALFADEPEWQARAEAFQAKVYELISFLVDVRGMTKVDAAFAGTVTYHDSCPGLRELGVRNQPRRLLKSVAGLKLTELEEADVCCGFGGTFCVKYPDISNAIVEKKTERIAATGAQTLLAGDLGCLMNMAGKLQRQSIPVETRHIAVRSSPRVHDVLLARNVPVAPSDWHGFTFVLPRTASSGSSFYFVEHRAEDETAAFFGPFSAPTGQDEGLAAK
jgi:L-lactate dehydrogenase complex protein LldE